MARPDHGCVGRHQRGEQTNRCVYILSTDVAEHPADQEDVSGHDILIRRRYGRVTDTHLDTSLGDTACSRSCVVGQANVLFNEMSADVTGTRVVFKDSDDVSALTGTDADELNGALNPVAQCIAEPFLDNRQASTD